MDSRRLKLLIQIYVTVAFTLPAYDVLLHMNCARKLFKQTWVLSVLRSSLAKNPGLLWGQESFLSTLKVPVSTIYSAESKVSH